MMLPTRSVLPFTSMSDGPSQELLSEGIAEDVVTELSALRWLLVIARNSNLIDRDAAADIRQVGRALGVRYALERDGHQPA